MLLFYLDETFPFNKIFLPELLKNSSEWNQHRIFNSNWPCAEERPEERNQWKHCEAQRFSFVFVFYPKWPIKTNWKHFIFINVSITARLILMQIIWRDSANSWHVMFKKSWALSKSLDKFLNDALVRKMH